MKNLKEKQLLVNFARALGQKPDPKLLEELQFVDNLKKKTVKSIRENTFTPKRLVEEETKIEVSNDEKDQSLTDIEEDNSLINRAVKFISEAPKESFQQPDPPKVPSDIQAITSKVKQLEQWVGKISMAGPGSGEVKLRFLDDIDRSTIGPNKHLAYSNVTGKFFFEEVVAGSEVVGDGYTIDIDGPNGNVISVINLPANTAIGPIQSMLYNPTQDLYSGNVTRQAGLTYYDSAEDTLEIIHADGAATYTGQDNYIRVYNNYGANLTKGTFVQFAGVVEDVATCAPFVNNANAVPLYSIGVLATDTGANTIGRAKLLGEIRNIDTTGASVGETWQSGDILWSNPVQPGTLTKVKPTAPNIVISVAAVLRANTTSGIMLVRPTVWPRLRYGDFYSILPQIASAPNQDTKVTITNVLISSGFTVDSGNSIVALDSGLYKFQTRIQLSSSSSSTKSIIVWYKRNGVNIPYSAVRQSISENGGYRTITNFQVISMDASDNVSIHFAVTDTTLSIDSPPVFDGAPNIPSIQLTVTEAAL